MAGTFPSRALPDVSRRLRVTPPRHDDRTATVRTHLLSGGIGPEAGGARTEYVHDAAGRPVGAASPTSSLTVERDILGRVLAETVDGRTTRYTYDALVRRTSRITPTGAVTELAYDAAGNRTALTASGHTLATVFDVLGAKLGPEPLKALFAQVARPLAAESTPGAFHRRWRVMAVDGTVFDVPDSEENAAHFGRPKTHRTERCAFPQVRVVALAERGTHAITAAALGPRTVSEPVLAREVLGALGEGDLLLADRGFTGLELWRAASAGGADLLWRIRAHQVLPVREELPDGSHLSEIVAARDHRRRADPVLCSVMRGQVPQPGGPGGPDAVFGPGPQAVTEFEVGDRPVSGVGGESGEPHAISVDEYQLGRSAAVPWGRSTACPSPSRPGGHL